MKITTRLCLNLQNMRETESEDVPVLQQETRRPREESKTGSCTAALKENLRKPFFFLVLWASGAASLHTLRKIAKIARDRL